MTKRTKSTTREFRIDNTVSAGVVGSIFLNDNFADFHFSFIEGDVCKRIPAHKAILCVASDVFATMLNGEWKEDNEVEIKDASFDAFKEFLQFFYLPKVTVSMENVWEVVNLANKYNVRECMDLCEPQIIDRLTLDAVCTSLDLAIRFDLRKLKEHCLKRIGDDTSKLLGTEAFLSCSKNTLEIILAIDRVDCSEIEIFNACINWAKHTCEANEKDPSIIANIRSELGDCLHAIRFGSMKPEQISNCVTSNEGLFNHSELLDLWLTIGSDRSKLKIFKNIATRQEPRIDHRMVVCNLQTNSFGQKTLKLRESIMFSISKTLLLGGISVRRLMPELSAINTSITSVKAELIVYKLSMPNYGTQILKQEAQLDVRWKDDNSQQYLKFENLVSVQANHEYEVCVCIKTESDNYSYYYSGATMRAHQQKRFDDSIVVETKNQCSDFINTLNFYSIDPERK